MSYCRHKRHRSRSQSRSSVTNRESQQNRSKDYDRRLESYEQRHYSSNNFFYKLEKYFSVII